MPERPLLSWLRLSVKLTINEGLFVLTELAYLRVFFAVPAASGRREHRRDWK